MFYLFLFMLLVVVIAVVTHRLNAKTPCAHDWKENGQAFKCTKCGKKIPDYTPVNTDSLTEAA